VNRGFTVFVLVLGFNSIYSDELEKLLRNGWNKSSSAITSVAERSSVLVSYLWVSSLIEAWMLDCVLFIVLHQGRVLTSVI
jgi:hypothetical protein